MPVTIITLVLSSFIGSNRIVEVTFQLMHRFIVSRAGDEHIISMKICLRM